MGLEKDKREALQKLAYTHYLIHVHFNSSVDVTHSTQIPDVLELTYINKDLFDKPPPLNKIPFPLDRLDFPNDAYHNQHILN